MTEYRTLLSNFIKKSTTVGLLRNDGTVDTTDYVSTSNTEGLIKNDGTIDTTSYLSAHQDITGKEDKSNKVTSISSSSTHIQYPSAKSVYDTIETKIDKLQRTVTTFNPRDYVVGEDGANWVNDNTVILPTDGNTITFNFTDMSKEVNLLYKKLNNGLRLSVAKVSVSQDTITERNTVSVTQTNNSLVMFFHN